MLQIGQYNILRIKEAVENGFLLESKEGGSQESKLFIPKYEVAKEYKTGDDIPVFLYRSSDDRVIATTKQPYCLAEQCDYLKVIEVNRIGAFLDWGLSKHLLLPYKEQESRVYVNKYYPVFVYLDKATDRLVASMNLGKFIKNKEVDLKAGQEVDIVVIKNINIGWKVVVNHRHWGMLYVDEVFQSVKVGQKLKAFVRKVRPDFKIDVRLQKDGRAGTEDAETILQKALEQGGGFLNLNDKSDPELIRKHLKMSKKTFKKAVGALYKKRLIVLEEDGIRLV